MSEPVFKMVSIIILTLLSMATVAPYSMTINDIHIEIHIYHGENITYKLMATIAIDENYISDIKAYMSYNGSYYQYSSRIKYSSQYYEEHRGNYGLKKIEDLWVKRIVSDKYFIIYTRSVFFEPKDFSNAKVSMLMDLSRYVSGYIDLDINIYINTTRDNDIFQFNVSTVIFKQLAKQSKMDTRYMVRRIDNVTYYIAWANVSNASFSVSDITKRIIRNYLGSYAPILCVSDLIAILRSIDEFYINTTYSDQVFIFNESGLGRISSILLNWTPLYVGVDGSTGDYIVRPPMGTPFYGLYRLTSVNNGNGQTYRLYVKYVYDYELEYTNKFLEGMASYIDKNLANTQSLQIHIDVDKGSLIYRHNRYKSIRLRQTNYTILYYLRYSAEQEFMGSSSEVLIYTVIALAVSSICLSIIIYLILCKRRKK